MVFPREMTVDSFAGFPVRNYTMALEWYQRLFGCPAAFLPNDIEAVFELAEHRYAFIKVLPDDAGHAFNLFFLSDLEKVVAEIADRGIVPATRETLEGGVIRIIYKDPDGNEVGFGGKI